MESHSENEIEYALRRAAEEPGDRPAFYKLLLDSKIFILGKSDSLDEGETVLRKDTNVAIIKWQDEDGNPVIPFFTSLLTLQRSIEQEQPYLALMARDFFELTQGSNLVLNPSSPYGKEFYPQEIATLLKSGTNSEPEHRLIEKETQVLLGQPADYPSEMISAITRLLSKHANVKAAYLASMNQPDVMPSKSLVVGIEGDGKIEEVIREVGAVAADTRPRELPVDLIQVQPSEAGLSEYMLNSTKPFYERSWGAKLKLAFGRGRA